jgi:putative transposase
MSYSKNWIHIIWATNNRAPLITEDIENKLHYFLKDQFKYKGCPVMAINGMPDHIHALVNLCPQFALSDVIKHVKGLSSHHVNKELEPPVPFAWQKGYAAFSVSESVLEKTYWYIHNQKRHHEVISSVEELNRFLVINKIPVAD